MTVIFNRHAPVILIGENCNIHESVVMGEHGFWYKDFVQQPPEGNDPYRIRIENNVDIRAGTTIHAGIKGYTLIKENTKIDANVHIAHDVQIGKNCVIGAGVMFGGRVTVGDNCEIWMGAILHQGIKLRNGSVVGANSYLRHNLGEDQVYYNGKVKWKDECKKFNEKLR